MNQEVTLQDFIMPEFRGKKPEDYEFREDGAIVRKDRWEKGIRKIALILTESGRCQFEIGNLVQAVEWLMSQVPDQEIPEERACPCCGCDPCECDPLSQY